jgi:hypothetical protein
LIKKFFIPSANEYVCLDSTYLPERSTEVIKTHISVALLIALFWGRGGGKIEHGYIDLHFAKESDLKVR